MNVWRRGSRDDAAAFSGRPIAEVVLAVGSGDVVVASQSAVAVVLARAHVEASEQFALRFDGAARDYHRAAFVLAEDVDDVDGLLRYADLVAVSTGAAGGVADASRALAQCGLVEVEGASGTVTMTLFATASADVGRLLQDAPLDVDVAEDLDAREDWFKRRHDPGRP